jgi:PleD family two-component response regulator
MILPTTSATQGEPAGDAEPAPELAIGSVLVVDDDESVRLILSEQLRDLGLDVAVAGCGEEFFMAADSCRYI